MSLTFELGVDSSTAVTLRPSLDYKGGHIKIDSRFRSKSGKLYSYKWGSYERFEFGAEYVAKANAEIVNSWWNSDTELLFFITSDGSTDVSSVMLQNKKSPFREYQFPYDTYMKGSIILETY